MWKRRWSLAVAALLALTATALVGAACGGDDDDETPSPAASASKTATTSASASAAAQSSPTTTKVPDPVTLRLGYFPNVTHAQALVMTGDGSLQKELGETVKLDTKVFNAGPAVIEAMFAGEIDASFIGPNPAINGFQRSNGEALRIVSGAASAGALFVVRPEANITAAKDLAGKKFATPQLGGTQDVALRAYLQDNGLKTKDKGGDVTILPTANADTLTLFQKGEIDGAWVPEPWGTRLILEAGGKV
ncbi:MAG: ABC transporter substrate-binding protein, partial [Dehalococcoidia bacterium]